MLNFLILLCFACVAASIYIVVRHQLNTYKCVIAGSTDYFQGCEHELWHLGPIEGVRRHDIILARAAQDGEKWKRGDVLLVDTMRGIYDKNQFGLFEKDDQYRIVKCIAAAGGSMPEIFDGNETYLSHTLIGRVIGVWNPIRNVHNYDI